MCGRFNIIDDPLTQLIVEIAGGDSKWSLNTLPLKTEFNIAPTQTIPVLVKSPEHGWMLRPMRWWLVPYWSPEPSTRYSMFNAKSETLATSRAYREPYKKRRCIIPASGYYEWRKEGGVKVPYYIEPDEDKGFAFAGLWDRWARDDRIVESCTIVTAAAPPAMKAIHPRIPVHLTTEQARRWSETDTPQPQLEEMLEPEIRTRLRVTPVSSYVSNARNKDDRCIERLGEPSIIH